MKRRDLLGAALAGAAVPAGAEDFPAHPARIIVPYAPGGGSDISARTVQPRVTELLHQTLVIDNRAGGGTLIGTHAVQTAAPDGYTVGVMDPAFLVNPALTPEAKYDPMRDFVPITLISVTPMILAVPATYPPRTLKEMVAYCKARPGRLNYGSPGLGSAGHLAIEQFRTHFGLTGTHVPYKGSGPAVAAIVAGEVDAFMAGSALIPMIQQGRLKGLAVTGKQRLKSLPGVPTFAELGFPEINVQTFAAVVAPASVPAPALKALRTAFSGAVKTPAVTALLEKNGQVAVGGSAEELATFFRDNLTSLNKVIRAADIKLE
jgi:tripartite-type tricarboxylate transporter receptor subunit TctC